MSVGVQKRSDRVSCDSNGGLTVGFAQEWPLVQIMRLSDDGA
jgi:hypothetical protein